MLIMDDFNSRQERTTATWKVSWVGKLFIGMCLTKQPCNRTVVLSTQIAHIAVSGSLLDVCNRRGADVHSDHQLLIASIR